MGTENLPVRNDNTTIYAEHVNIYRRTLLGNLVPRNGSGVPQSGAGYLGTSTQRWGPCFVEKIAFGTISDDCSFEVDGSGNISVIVGGVVRGTFTPDGYIGSYGPLSVTTAAVANKGITTAKINDLAVGTGQIASAAVTSSKLATGTNERNWVLARTAAAGGGAVGTYAFLRNGSGTNLGIGDTLGGSSLHQASAGATYTTAALGYGTWMCMGLALNTGTDERHSLFLRIS